MRERPTLASRVFGCSRPAGSNSSVFRLSCWRDGGGIISLPDYPPKGYPSKPLAEQNIVAAKKALTQGEPEPALELILGVRTVRPGLFRSDQVEVTYTAGKRRFVERYPVQITLCAPFDAYGPGCAPQGP